MSRATRWLPSGADAQRRRQDDVFRLYLTGAFSAVGRANPRFISVPPQLFGAHIHLDPATRS